MNETHKSSLDTKHHFCLSKTLETLYVSLEWASAFFREDRPIKELTTRCGFDWHWCNPISLGGAGFYINKFQLGSAKELLKMSFHYGQVISGSCITMFLLLWFHEIIDSCLWLFVEWTALCRRIQISSFTSLLVGKLVKLTLISSVLASQLALNGEQ